MARQFVTVKFRQAGIHFWPDAPESSHLAHPHRHEFHFTVWLEVKHGDREVEFIGLKEELQTYMQHRMEEVTYSCEALCDQVIAYLKDRHTGRAVRVWVEEDGENGGYTETD